MRSKVSSTPIISIMANKSGPLAYPTKDKRKQLLFDPYLIPFPIYIA